MSLSSFPLLDRPSNVSVVDACPLLTSLPARQRGDLASHSFMAYAERDETIWTIGSPSNFIAIVGRGSVRLTRTRPDGKEVDLAVLGPGQSFGMEAICGGSFHQANAIAAEHTWYLKVPSHVITTILGEPDIIRP